MLEDVYKKLLKSKNKTLDDMSAALNLDPEIIIRIIIKKEVGEDLSGIVLEEKVDEKRKEELEVPKVKMERDLEALFLGRLKKRAYSASSLNKRYKADSLKEVENILEKLAKEGKVRKRESKNKKGAYVYEAL
ncbi:MAG: hypothetical protein ACE5K0_12255 [Candidatus Methanofastidiosia archaeon]